MAGYISINEIMERQPLFVFALETEASEVFEGVDKLIVGIGKLNAAFHLTKALLSKRPGLIVNLGSAGSSEFERGSIVSCSRFIQRDMDATALGYLRYETPLSGLNPILEYGLKVKGLEDGICGTGDAFETAHAGTDYQVIDMEAYALAFVARQESIPFLCLKYISDGGDGKAAEDWTIQVHQTALTFKKLLGI